MITNERQYLNTRALVGRFRQALEQFEEQNAELDPILRQAMREGIAGEMMLLQAELTQYEDIRSGVIRDFATDSFDEIPDLLILGRIARGLTHKELAAELGIKEQQLQRYEKSHYAQTAFSRLAEVAVVLGLRVHVEASTEKSTTLSEVEYTLDSSRSRPIPVSLSPVSNTTQAAPYILPRSRVMMPFIAQSSAA